jgi:tetratricopeptide (TPR) repeat protein
VSQLEAQAVGAKDPADAQRVLAETRARAGDAYVAYARGLAMTDDRAYGQALWKGIGLYDQAGDLPRAIAALEVFTHDRPSDPLTPDAYFRLGQIYHAHGEYDKAIGAYRQLQERYTGSLAASKSGVPMAQALIAKGPDFYDRAEQVLRGVIIGNPAINPNALEFREALAELASLYYKTHRYEAAIAKLEELTQRFPTDARLGQLNFLMADSYRKSAAALQERLVAARQPDQVKPGFNIEEAATERADRLEKAGFLYRKVVDIYAATAPRTELDRLYQRLAYFYQADCLYDLGKYADAIRLYDVAAFHFQDDPSALAAYVQIVNANLAMGKPEEAKAANERAKWMLQRMPADSFNRDGTVLTRTGWEKWLQSSQAGLWN